MTIEHLKKDLRKVVAAIGVVEGQAIKRSTPEATSFLEGFKADRQATRKGYVNIITGDQTTVINDLVRMQAKEEYLTGLIDAYEEPAIQKKSLVMQKEKLLSLIAEKENAHVGR